jgi:hypothetical protein
MPIKKRLSEDQRIKKQLPKHWRAAFRHPLLKKFTYGNGWTLTPKSLAHAIEKTAKWKGASYTEKCLVLALDTILEKSHGISVLEPETYNRLQAHLESSQTKIEAENFRAWHIWCWDIYHDHYRLHDMEVGDLRLPEPPKSTRKALRKKIKRRKLLKK